MKSLPNIHRGNHLPFWVCHVEKRGFISYRLVLIIQSWIQQGVCSLQLISTVKYLSLIKCYTSPPLTSPSGSSDNHSENSYNITSYMYLYHNKLAVLHFEHFLMLFSGNLIALTLQVYKILKRNYMFVVVFSKSVTPRPFYPWWVCAVDVRQNVVIRFIQPGIPKSL